MASPIGMPRRPTVPSFNIFSATAPSAANVTAAATATALNQDIFIISMCSLSKKRACLGDIIIIDRIARK